MAANETQVKKYVLSEEELAALSSATRDQLAREQKAKEANKAVTYSATNGRAALAGAFIREILMENPNRQFKKEELVRILSREPYGIEVKRQTVARYTKTLAQEARYHITDNKAGVTYVLQS